MASCICISFVWRTFPTAVARSRPSSTRSWLRAPRPGTLRSARGERDACLLTSAQLHEFGSTSGSGSRFRSTTDAPRIVPASFAAGARPVGVIDLSYLIDLDHVLDRALDAPAYEAIVAHLSTAEVAS